jgi:hypothetical protein
MVSTGEFSSIRSPSDGGQPERNLRGAPDEALGLGSALGLGQQLGSDPADRHVLQQTQQRHLDRRHRQDADRADLEQSARDGGQALVVVPLADGDAIPLVGPGRGPRRLDGHSVGHPIDLAEHPLQTGQLIGVLGVEGVAAQHLTGELVRGLAVLELVVDLDTELIGESLHPVVGVADPLRSQLERDTIHLLGEDSSADPLVSLQDERLPSGVENLAGRSEPRQSCADDDHISFACHPAS